MLPQSVWSAPGPTSGRTGTEEVLEGNGGFRVYRDELKVRIDPKFKLEKGATVFASGSCFAREIELSLHERGLGVLSWNPTIDLPNSHFHRYNTFSMINDFHFAFNRNYGPEFVEKVGERYSDFSGYGFFDSLNEAVATRQRVIDRHSLATNADVIILTLGLVEAWYDNKNEVYFNTPPYPLLRSTDGRLELRISGYEENLNAVQNIIHILSEINHKIKIILTVSPVPLSDTFSGQDVVVANTYSKSVLRTVAQDIADMHENVDYFPSYEMVMFSDPAASWKSDHRHVTKERVAYIVSQFITHYVS